MKNGLSRLARSVLAAALIASPLQQACAAVIATEEVASQTSADAARERVRAALQRADVQRELVALGVDPQAVGERLGALSNEEVAQLAGKIDQAAAGGAMRQSDLLLIIIIVLLLVILL